MATWFMGNSEHSLDDKGRVIIPSKFRDQVDPDVDGPGFVATQAPEGCVFLYTPREWRHMCQGQTSLPKGSHELRMFQRLWHGNAEQLSLDKQGRVQLPKRLRELAELDKEVVLAGCYDRIELWSKPRWAAMRARASTTYADQMQAFLTGDNPQAAEADAEEDR